MQKLGAILRQKGKFYYVFLVMNRGTGSKSNFEQVYGQYHREKEAITMCRRQNRISMCIQCRFKKECKFAR